MRASVVLPQPDSPAIPRVSPRIRSKLIPSTATILLAPDVASPAVREKALCKSRALRIVSVGFTDMGRRFLGQGCNARNAAARPPRDLEPPRRTQIDETRSAGRRCNPQVNH